MCFNALRNSSAYTLDYSEEQTILDSDFIIVNHHFVTNNWMTREVVESYGKPVFCIVTEVALYGDMINDKVPDYFTHYIVLDPTIAETDRIHGFGRPLTPVDVVVNPPSVPTIGMFGFATMGKQWTTLIENVNAEFDSAIVRINIPHATYVPTHDREYVVAEIANAARLTHPGIRVQVTDTYYSDTELVQWCAGNTINCFFYCRDHVYQSGLAAVTDQAILAGVPLLVTTDKTFRHIHKYIPAYPNIDIRTAINTTLPGVLQMREDWSAKNFQAKFEQILTKSIHTESRP